MKKPKTVKGYLKLLIGIANDSVHDLKNITEEEKDAIAAIRADIQNQLGEMTEILKDHKLQPWT